jgi:hypothetical protein
MPTGPSAPAGAIRGPEVKAAMAESSGAESDEVSAAATFIPPQPRLFAPGKQPVMAYIGNDVHEEIALIYEAMHRGDDIYLRAPA